ncbi:MAG: OsmC family protein, partial [Cyclobacteriaceae bacterium]|nr:OsmC family protein [Cyclobacteriaceae bacterium]MDX5467949.1 OsmC family protein [Cyclobacteriaceae bacterium]
LGEINVYLNHEKVHREDSDLLETGGGKISKFSRLLEIKGNITEEMEDKLLEIADKCPVHKTLHEPIEVETRMLKEGKGAR